MDGKDCALFKFFTGELLIGDDEFDESSTISTTKLKNKISRGQWNKCTVTSIAK